MRRKFTKSQRLFKRVSKMIPLASQTFSKSYLQYVKGASPLFVTRGHGARIWDVDGNVYVDMINGLLPVILGYCDQAVDTAIKRQLKLGITFSLPSPLELELAALLVAEIPGAEMVRFGKNGSDVTTGAIRLARAVTGRDQVAVCGYHGWHDWYIGSTTRHLGVPQSTRDLTHRFVYNDITSLEKIFEAAPNQIAAVIMEPMSYEEPRDNFLAKVKALAHQHSALLVFDEVITGFRFALGGAQQLFGVVPDLSTFGKAMANGMPLSALVGKRQYMEKASDIFYSFTNGGETLSLAAAIATIKEIKRRKVIPYLWRLGDFLQTETNRLLAKHGLTELIKIGGKPCWQVFTFQSSGEYSDLEIKTYVQQELLQAGFLWFGQHNMSFSHTRSQMGRLVATYDRVFGQLKTLVDTHRLKAELRGGLITNIFKVR